MSNSTNEFQQSYNEVTNTIDEEHSQFLREIIHSRRSVRKYQEKIISKEHIKKLIDAANWAPSACNKQSWKFIIIDEKDKIKKLTSKGAASFLKNSNYAILVLYDNRTDNIEYHDHIQSASAAIQNMLLMASSLGIGACWVCNLPPKKFIRCLFSIPKCYDPIALVSIGWPYSEKPPGRKRKYTFKQLVSYNSFNLPYEKTTSGANIKLMIKRLARKFFYALPKNHFLKKYAKKYEKKFNDY